MIGLGLVVLGWVLVGAATVPLATWPPPPLPWWSWVTVVLGALSAWLGLDRIPAWRRFISRRQRGYGSLRVRILIVLIVLPPSIATGAFIVTVVLHRSIYGS